MNPTFWKGRRVLVTGHTGFKGAWLCLLLHRMGATTAGYALDPPGHPSLFEQASVSSTLARDTRADVRDLDRLRNEVREVAPEVVIHMAAQSLVRPSYEDPVETFSSNVQGTVNLLEAVRHSTSVQSAVVVTSDKSYRSEEWVWGYRENDRLGGKDPYSASKAASELIVESYRSSFFGVDAHEAARVGSARAGNVIGGGDWSEMRLLPDLMRGFITGEEVVIRSPRAVRPWQHALEPLAGYLLLAERLQERTPGADAAWNFGPEDGDMRTVGWVCDRASGLWGEPAAWRVEEIDDGRETALLRLDTTKARQQLGWRPHWELETGLDRTISWYRTVGRDPSPSSRAREATMSDIEAFLDTPPPTRAL
ncbi:MAG: CDP-glucose 4,6-dehydratase [Gaiellaceae bacterium]